MSTANDAAIAGAKLLLELHEIEANNEPSLLPLLPTLWSAGPDAVGNVAALITSATMICEALKMMDASRQNGGTIEDMRAAFQEEAVHSDEPAPTPAEEEAFALALAPKMREMMDLVRDRLPRDTHFAILVEGQAPGYARVFAASTNRERMALRATEWATSVRHG